MATPHTPGWSALGVGLALAVARSGAVLAVGVPGDWRTRRGGPGQEGGARQQPRPDARGEARAVPGDRGRPLPLRPLPSPWALAAGLGATASPRAGARYRR